jgi:hypothetical protein
MPKGNLVISIELLTTFLGWCSLINVGVLVLSTIILILKKDAIIAMHARWFAIDRQALPSVYFEYLGHYKIAILVFNLVPYLALKIMV